MRCFKCVSVGSWTCSLLQLQSIFHHLRPLDEVIRKNSARITCTADWITIHIDCCDEIVRLEEDSVEFHLRHINSEDVAIGFCGWRKKSNRNHCQKNFLTNEKVSDGKSFVVWWIEWFPLQIEGNCHDGINRIVCGTPEENFQLIVVESDVTENIGNHHVPVDGSDDLQWILRQSDTLDEFFFERWRSTIWVVFGFNWCDDITPHHNTSTRCDRHGCGWIFDESRVDKPKADWNCPGRKMLMKFSHFAVLQVKILWKVWEENANRTHWPNEIPFLVVTTNISDSPVLQLNWIFCTRSNFSGISKKSTIEFKLK
jgi:hypothetical protein